MVQQFEFHLHITGPEGERDFVIPQGETLIGREPSSDLPLAYPMISRRHARLDCSASACTITDLESANGTLVDGTRIEANVPVPLADQTRIAIGPFEIVCTQVSLAVEEPDLMEPEPPVPEPPPPKPEVDEVTAGEPEEESEEQKPGEAEKPDESKKKPPKKPVRRSKPSKDAETPAEAPPPEPPSDGGVPHLAEVPPWQRPVPGLFLESQRLIKFLPGIYDTDFMRRFLGLFESILTPIEWNVDNFDLFLDSGTAPYDFLPWLSAWYEILFNSTWTETQRRTLLKEAPRLYARRGTRWALSRLIEIYIGAAPEIVEFADPDDPFTFTIKLPLRARDVRRELLEGLIDASKPAQTSYILEFQK
jgi:phage tail-like protein